MSAGWIALFVALWLVVLFLVVLVLGLIRKVAALETDLAWGAHEPSYVGGPPVGTLAPSLTPNRELTSTPDSAHRRLVLFLNSSCGACQRLAGELRTAGRTTPASESAARDFELILVTDLNGRDAYADVDVDAMVVQTGAELSRTWSVPGTPFAVAVDKHGVVRGSAFAGTIAELGELSSVLAASVGPGVESAVVEHGVGDTKHIIFRG